MVKLIEAETGIGPARQPRLSSKAFEEEALASAYRASEAGDLLLSLIQLHQEYPPATLAKAIPLLNAAVPKWDQPTGEDWPAKATLLRHKRHRKDVLQAFEDYLPAAHLWAAMAAGEAGVPECRPDSHSTLPVFLSVADEIARMATRIRWYGNDRRVVLPKGLAWSFKVPSTLKRTSSIKIPRLSPAQLAELNISSPPN